ncbi:MAG: 3-keto-5-aminohexanoate cleavage protein [Chloroflexi bacterium]|nr:3-keto-5-aminohexanoate cleavage protein [Chloroflexota bacterium]
MEQVSALFDPSSQEEWVERVARGTLPPLMITVAITGGVQGKEINPNHPETAEEQVEQLKECYKLGATMVHLHVRRPDNPTLTASDPKEYRKVNGMIREACPEIIINNTTGGGIGAESHEARLASTEANPEVCSLDCGPIVSRFTLKARKPPLFGRDKDFELDTCASVTYGETERYAKIMLEKGIKPELEVWTTGHYWLVRNLISKELVKPPYLIGLVMGFGGGAYATPKEVIHLMECGPKRSVYSVLGVGLYQTQMVALGIMLGINVRTGMEDNVLYKKGELCKNNAQLVERVVRIAREMGREIATPKQARQMLGLSEKPSRY